MVASTPRISIVLPTYNRARFLADAFASIRDQTFRDWELIVVDDGSTDDTSAVLETLAAEFDRPLTVLRQPNGGPSAARNTGLDAARGEYVAFLDSDDTWTPTHLAELVAVLDDHVDVDWVFGPARTITWRTGEVVEADRFHPKGRPHPFLSLNTDPRGPAKLVQDERFLPLQILDGMPCLLQASLVRRAFFDDLRFWPESRILEDINLFTRAIAAGKRFAYVEAIQLDYRVHDDHTSFVGEANGLCAYEIARSREKYENILAIGDRLIASGELPKVGERALRRRMSDTEFWCLGYATLWTNGRHTEARHHFRRAVTRYPWDLRYWKTWLLSLTRRQAEPEAGTA